MARTRRHRPGQARVRPDRVPLWLRKHCDSCRNPVILAEEDQGGRLAAAVVEPDPDPAGQLTRRADGYLARDPQHLAEGLRYRWHSCPVRNRL